MKNKIIIIISIIVAIIIMIGGYFITQKFKQRVNFINPELADKTMEESTENGTIFNKTFGSYEVPKNWVESKSHSTKDKFFYVLKGEEKNTKPNNISVNSGTNKYSKEEHEEFRKAILNQISFQIRNKKGVEINANGSYTDKGEIVYTFIIKEENVITTQYYIVGNYKYILVHETVFEESEETDNAAKNIVNTFKWKE